MWLHAATRLEFDARVATPFLLMLRPRSGWQQWVGSAALGRSTAVEMPSAVI